MADTGWEHRRRRSANAIEVAALGLFAEDGYPSVTVQDIARAAGIHERTFFRYFASKDDVLLALPRRSITLVADALAARPADELLFESFAEAIGSAGTMLAAERDLRLTWAAAMESAPDLGYQVSGEVSALLFETVAAAVAKRIDDSVDSMRVGAIAAAVVGLLGFVWDRWLGDGGEGDLTSMVTVAFRLVESTRREVTEAGDDEIEALRARVEDLTLEREIFKRAAAAAVERG